MEVSPYCAACVKGHAAVASYLMSQGAVIDIYTAAYLGEERILVSLLDEDNHLLNQPVWQTDDYCTVPLSYAVCGVQPGAVEILIDRGAEVAEHSAFILHYCMQVTEGLRLKKKPIDDCLTILKLLLEHGADAKALKAPISANDEVGTLLQYYGVAGDPNRFESGGWPALAYLCRGDRGGNPAEVLRLLELGADVAQRNHRGKTALHVAAKSGFVPAITLLIEHGADPDVTDPQGETPLFDIVRSTIKRTERKVGAVRLQLKHGVDVTRRNKKGQRVIDVAHLVKHPVPADVLKLLQ